MERKPTSTLLPSLAPLLTTEKASAESENTSPPLLSTFEIGRRGEEALNQQLEAEGYMIVRRNWRTPYGELDLVASREGSLWIFEVKTRRSDAVKGRVLINNTQRRRLASAALWVWQKERKNYSRFCCRLVLVTECGIKWINLPLLYDQA